MFCYIIGNPGLHRSQESVRRSRLVLAFIASWSHRPSRTNSFVFVLLYYWDIWKRYRSKKNWFCGQICIGCYRSLVAPPEQNKQFCICFCILLWIPGSIVKKNRHCPIVSPHVQQKTHGLAIFWLFFVDIHHRLRPRRGLGRSGLLEGKNAADFYTYFFNVFCKSWLTSHYWLNDWLHRPSKTNGR